MLRKVALLVTPGVAPFEFGVVCEVFGIDRTREGAPPFDFTVVTANPGPIRTSLGFDMTVEHGLDAAEDADLIAVVANMTSVAHSIDDASLDLLRRAEARGAWVLSLCTGAFVLAEAGLLDGRRSTTHWDHSARLAAQFPLTDVDPNVLYIEDRGVITGAGTAAGIDACLHLVRREHGQAAANVIARRMVVPPHRDGGQAQYIPYPVPTRASDSLAAVTDWMLENLAEELPVELLAQKAHMSERTFARRFRAELGATPAAWLNRQRLLRAQHLLEHGDEGLERVAQESGFGSASVMRHHFVKVLHTTPNDYRRTFGRSLPSAEERMRELAG
jgi:transcriptional regulator GlxA family with amidase domain